MKTNPRCLGALIVCMAFLSVSGFLGGIALLEDSSGGNLGTPIRDFTLPALFENSTGTHMPTPDAILAGLTRIANDWKLLAIGWHVYFGILILLVMQHSRFRTRTRTLGLLLSIPLLSVSFLAWTIENYFNGLVFAAVGLALAWIAATLQNDPVDVASPCWVFAGALFFLFKWIYPHFLEASAAWDYLYASPTGLIPCPTLSAVIGVSLIVNGLGSRAWTFVLGATGLVYGVIGTFRLDVVIDGVLLAGSLTLMMAGFLPEVSRQRIEA